MKGCGELVEAERLEALVVENGFVKDRRGQILKKRSG